jgi:hypothetical protein
MGIVLAILYVVVVGILSVCKASLLPTTDRLSWAEVIYGPAITVISCFILLLVAIGMEDLVTSRKGRK